MLPSPENPEQKLERLLQKTLRDLPPRRAPSSLERRVFAELDRRATLPVWRKSYVHWPLPARCAFLLGSAVVMKLVLLAAIWVMVGFENASFVAAFSQPFSWLHSVTDFASSLVEFGGAVLYSIPRFWLYAGAVCLVSMYATLVGLGTFTYRLMHAKR